MGYDYLNCKKCLEIYRDECFLQCAICEAFIEICEKCFDVNKNKFGNYKKSVLKKLILNNKHSGLVICDECIRCYNIEDLEYIEDIDDYNINKISLDKKISNLKKKLK